MDPATEDTKLCNNCKREISAANYVMHEMHCRRHIALCEHCQEPVPRAEMEQHFNELHATTQCLLCRQEISKDKMDNHVAHECERRPIPCEYCELSFPKREFEAHSDFCGSRTECCPLCQQYVMLKDMLRHENSGCTYPPPKPAPPPRQPSPPQLGDLDPFSMFEMQQLLDGEDFDIPGARSNFGVNLQPDRNGIHRRVGGVTGAQGARAAGGVTRQQQGRGGVKRDNSRRKADVNVQRGNNLANQGSSSKDFDLPMDMDFDTMLALQLSHDDLLQDDMPDIDDLSNLRSHPSHPADPRQENLAAELEARDRRDNREYNEDNIVAKIPCEFCDEDYITHLEFCPLSNAGASDSGPNDLNNETNVTASATGRPSIPVINNLGTPSLPSYQDLSPDFEEDFILPCEFCEEMFPSEIIIQHQSVCQANGLVTPRVTTPAAGMRTSHSMPLFGPGSNQPAHLLTGEELSRSLLSFIPPEGSRASADRLASIEADLPSIPQSSSNKYSRPVDRFDADLARPPRRSSKPSISDEWEADQSNGAAAAASGVRHAKRENSSAQRARARLNQLLQEGGDQGHDPVLSPGSGTKSSRPVASPAARKSNVDSRAVMRQLNNTRPRSNRTNATVASQASGRQHVASTNGNSNNLARPPRQRADGLFSPELRLKPDHNPRSKK